MRLKIAKKNIGLNATSVMARGLRVETQMTKSTRELQLNLIAPKCKEIPL
jgi:hypothetical protein